ncbi:MAG: hypothetical protein V1861_00815 [Candidatus Micrarchaeota archaeon]
MGPIQKPPQTQTANCGNTQQKPQPSRAGTGSMIWHSGQPKQGPGTIVTPWGEPASEYLRRQEGKVEYVEIFTSCRVQKDYGPFLIIYDGWKFKKCPHMVEGYEEPSASEIKRFKRDVAEAALTDARIAGLVKRERALQIESKPNDL